MFEVDPLQPSSEPTPARIIVPPATRAFFGIRWIKSTERLLLLLGILAAIILTLLFVILGKNGFTEEAIVATISGPNEAASGDILEYTLTIKNTSKIGVNQLGFDFFYPRDAVVIADDKIIPTIKSTIDVGEIPPGEERSFRFSSLLVGDKGNIKTARAVMHFRAEGFTSLFEKTVEHGTTITSMPIELTLAPPPMVINGQPIQYLVDYRNTSQETFADIRLRIAISDDFKAEKYQPMFDESQSVAQMLTKTWIIPSLAPGEGGRIMIDGTISGKEREQKVISATLQKKLQLSSGEQYVDFEKAESSSTIISPFLSLATQVNDREGGSYVAHLGDRLNYKITVRNDSDYDLSGVSVTAVLDGAMYDLSTVESDGFFDSRTNTLTWDAAADSKLVLLETRQSVTLPFSVELKDSFVGGNTKESFVQAAVRTQTSLIPAQLTIPIISANYEKTETGYKCKKCGSEILQTTLYASMHDSLWQGMCAGRGEVRKFPLPYCPKCEGEPKNTRTCIHE